MLYVDSFAANVDAVSKASEEVQWLCMLTLGAMTTAAAAGKAREQMQRQLTILKWLCDVLLPGAVQQMEGTMWVATETRLPLPSHLGKMQDMNLNVRLV